jgi:hypothetical protein
MIAVREICLVYLFPQPVLKTNTLCSFSLGYYSEPGSAACTVCPAGSNCRSQAVTPGGTPPLCPAGNFSFQGADGCSSCEIGI